MFLGGKDEESPPVVRGVAATGVVLQVLRLLTSVVRSSEVQLDTQRDPSASCAPKWLGARARVMTWVDMWGKRSLEKLTEALMSHEPLGILST